MHSYHQILNRVNNQKISSTSYLYVEGVDSVLISGSRPWGLKEKALEQSKLYSPHEK